VAPSQPDALEHARALEVPRAQPAPAAGSGSILAAPRPPRVAAPQPIEPSRRDDASPVLRRTRAPAPASIGPPARRGMQIIDLRPETPAPAPTGGTRRGARELELGAASE